MFSKSNIQYVEILRNNAELGCECNLQIYPDENLVLRNAQLDENNTPENAKVNFFSALTSESKHLKMGVRTKPSGYIYILQRGHAQYWHYNFTHQITFEGKYLVVLSTYAFAKAVFLIIPAAMYTQ